MVPNTPLVDSPTVVYLSRLGGPASVIARDSIA
jgi:hypothetical protein